MARFDDAGELDILVDDGTITGELIDMTADVVADMHRTAPIVRRPHQSRIVAGLTRQLSRDVAAAVTEAEEKADVALWTHKASERLMRDAARVDRRGRHGFVRRCHGDLHLSNICLWKGRPTPFDAIEFSEEIAVIDVLYDLAFVLVDLEHRGRGDLATRLLSRYLAATRDYSGLAALPLYKSQRHMVRALTGATKGRPVADHIAAARAIAERAVAPHLYAIGGLSGSGKTTIARAVAPELGAVVIRADTVRKHIWGVAPEVHLGAAAYDAVTTERVYRRLRVDAARALRAGSSVVLDATFADPADRAAVRRLANHLGVPFAGIWLKAPRAILAERVAGRSGDASDADVAVVEAQSHRDLGAIDWIDVAANAEPDEVAMAALGYLAPVARTAQRPPPRRGAPR
nr:bifunctional aminoglycoside phosphotransferase/ATP-binding protein [Acuticoccus mangrovi]